MTNSGEALPPVDYSSLPQPRPTPQPARRPSNSLLSPGYNDEQYEAEPRYELAYSEAEERPTGVTIVAVLNFIAAAIYAIVMLIAWAGARDDSDLVGPAIISAIQVLISLVVGVGLWKLQRWAYNLAIVGYILSLGSTLLSSLNETLTGTTLLSLAIPAIILVYLFQSSVREAFR